MVKKQDLRITKTLRGIKQAFLTLVTEEPYRKITIVQIARGAEINRKTFYLHYESIDALLYDIENDYVETLTASFSLLPPDDLAGAIFKYYEFLNTDDMSVQTLLYGKDYRGFFKKLDSDIISCDFMKRFYENSPYISISKGYMDAMTGIFLRWREEEYPAYELDELAERTADLILNGLSAIE